MLFEINRKDDLMQLKDIMTDNVVSVNSNSTVEQTAMLMQKHNIGSVPVCDGNNIKGIVTDRDLVLRNIASGQDPKSSKIGNIMSANLTYGHPDMQVEEASRLMAKYQIRRLPVVEGNKLVGMVSLGDVAVNPEYDMEASEALSEISTPSKPNKLK